MDKSTQLKMKRFWLALAVAHLVLVVLGALHVAFWNWGPLGRDLDSYGVLSGAGSSYPFFAPVVGTSIRAEFDLFDSSGASIGTDSLMNASTRETNLRLSNIVEMIDEDLMNDENRHLLGASWAGKIFSRHPNASKLTLRVETFDLPTMQEYRGGMRYEWETIYKATYTRNKGTTGADKN